MIIKRMHYNKSNFLLASTSRLKERYVLLSADGPYRNVLKFKSPLVFGLDDAKELVSKLDSIMDEMEQVEVCCALNLRMMKMQ